MNEKILVPEELALNKPKSELLHIINNKKFDDKILFETESDFHNIKVVENEIGRFLHFGETYQAGFINTPFYHGNLPYINYFLLSYLINPKIKKILLIGLGTGKIVKDFEFLFEELKTINAVDIEENILPVAMNYFNFKPSEKFHFILQDGITYLRNSKEKYDLIVTDIANNDGIDLRFLENEYFELIKKNLKKSGIFISNMCACADFENSKNIFFKKYFKIYKQYFQNNIIIKGNYSDEVYYKSFFDIDERVIDITNVIIISSDRYNSIKQTKSAKEKIFNLGVNIDNYIKDIYPQI